MSAQLGGRLTSEELAQWAETLDESAREFYDERAGILQFEAKLSRLESERHAYQMTLDWMATRRT